jgi:hypothetical protein
MKRTNRLFQSFPAVIEQPGKGQFPMADIVLAKLEAVGSESDVRGIPPPFSVLYLAHALEKVGYSLKVIHEEATKANIQTLVNLISIEKPFLVGFSVVMGPQILPSLTASR